MHCISFLHTARMPYGAKGTSPWGVVRNRCCALGRIILRGPDGTNVCTGQFLCLWLNCLGCLGRGGLVLCFFDYWLLLKRLPFLVDPQLIPGVEYFGDGVMPRQSLSVVSIICYLFVVVDDASVLARKPDLYYPLSLLCWVLLQSPDLRLTASAMASIG